MTIKQNGGIFGRNPTFNDVTIEGELSTSGAFNPSGDLTLGGDFSMSSATPNIKITDTDLAHGMTTLTETDTLLTQAPETASNGGVRWSAYSADNIAMQFAGYSTTPSTDGNGAVFRFRAAKKSGTTETALADGEDIVTFGNTGTEVVTIKGNGNIVFANSGAGIDFSATSDGSGTSSSELLDDYEEGTWTPTYFPASGAFDAISYNIQEGYYTKIGNMVYLRLSMRITSLTKGTASGNVYVGGLPYTAANSRSTGPVLSSNFLDDHPSFCQPSFNSLYLYYKDAADGSGTNILNVTDLDTGSTDNAMTIFVCYQTS